MPDEHAVYWVNQPGLPEGEYVPLADFEILRAERDALEAELRSVRSDAARYARILRELGVDPLAGLP